MLTMITPNVCMIMSHKGLHQACDYVIHMNIIRAIKIKCDFVIYGFGIHVNTLYIYLSDLVTVV